MPKFFPHARRLMQREVALAQFWLSPGSSAVTPPSHGRGPHTAEAVMGYAKARGSAFEASCLRIREGCHRLRTLSLRFSVFNQGEG